MNVLEMAPGDAISILNADVEVDFAAPVGYVEPQRSPQPETKSPRPMHIVEVRYLLFVAKEVSAGL